MGKHITVEQRYQIEAYFNAGYSQTEIALQLGKDKSVISREYRRNRLQSGVYRAKSAQLFYEHARKPCRKKSKFSNEALLSFVLSELKSDKSPEQITGIMKLRKMDNIVSHERIYQYIWEDKHKGGLLYKHLRNKGRRYRKRGNLKDSRGIISDRVFIDERPVIVDKKERIGDIEIDLVIGRHHKQAILTVVERKSGMAWLRKLQNKSAQGVEEKLIEILLPIRKYIYTITSDNGKEFARHKTIAEKLLAQFYFAHPYHSWERGCNENYNRLLRQYFPKKTDFSTITEEQLEAIQLKINTRERKRLGYLSPIQYLHNNSLTKVAFRT